jgi:hypothetical protein
MSKLFFDVAMSLDGYIAGPNRGPRNRIDESTLHIAPATSRPSRWR